MSRYRKVEVRTWGDDKFRELSPIPPSGQGLWLFLITGPHTGPIPGLFRAGRAGMAEELGWELEAFDKAFAEAFGKGMVKADFSARLVWLPNAIRHNKPESPNVVKSWGSEFDLLPECELKWEAYRSIKSFIYTMPQGFREAFDEAFPKPYGKASVKTSPNQEQEQEQEQKQEKDVRAEPQAGSTPFHVELSPVFIELPLNTGKLWAVREVYVDSLRELFPGVDVKQALRSMRAWLDAKPNRRKTERGIKAFITNWLTKDQDSGRSARAAAPTTAKNGTSFAADAWDELFRAVQAGRQPPTWSYPLTSEALADIGGWSAVKEMKTDDVPFRRREFVAAYDKRAH